MQVLADRLSRMTTRRYLSFACLLLLLSLPLFQLGAQDTIHVLKKGETLYSLAKTYGISFADLVAANKLVDAGKVQVGQKIVIPGKVESLPAAADRTSSEHVVQKGETLYGIARKYGMGITELRTLNSLKEDSVLKVGARLVVTVPAQAKTVVAADTPNPPARKPDSGSNTETRSLIAGSIDSRVLWPVRAKELAYLDGKLYGVLLTAERSERVLSLTDGMVVSAEPYRGFGKVAIVQAPTGLVYVYGGNESLSVKQGDRIASGSELGRLGMDALSGKPQLFLFVYKDNKAIDPATAPRS